MPVESNRVQPELGGVVTALNVDVLGLISVGGIKEEPIGSDSQDGRHWLFSDLSSATALHTIEHALADLSA